MNINTDHARQQAEAQMERIQQIMQWYEHANKCDEYGRKCDHNLEAVSDYGLTFNESFDVDTVTQAINETPLSVEVRGGWLPVGTYEPDRPTDYRILLCVGGSAVRVVGWLDGFGNPETARLEYQDWFIPWTEYTDHDYVLLEFARMFYYHS
jgi:hypothetical protein